VAGYIDVDDRLAVARGGVFRTSPDVHTGRRDGGENATAQAALPSALPA
jgi:hypothetical protein